MRKKNASLRWLLLITIVSLIPSSNIDAFFSPTQWAKKAKKFGSESFEYCKNHKKEVMIGTTLFLGGAYLGNLYARNLFNQQLNYILDKLNFILNQDKKHNGQILPQLGAQAVINSGLPQRNTLGMLLGLTSLFFSGHQIYKEFFTDNAFKSEEQVRVRFTDVVGGVPEEIAQLAAIINSPNRYTGVTTPKGILLSGKPGTGKTLLARAIAGETNCSFFSANGASFNQEFRGTGTRRLNALFAAAALAAKNGKKSIIFIDEFDALASKRTHTGIEFASRDSNATINTLLDLMDGFSSNDNIIVIAATNFPSSLDEAVVRSGRFDHRIEIPLPDTPKRTAIWKYYQEKLCPQMAVFEELVNNLSEHSDGMSGADIKSIFESAKRSAAYTTVPVEKELLYTHFNKHVAEFNVGKFIITMLENNQVEN
ncbi:MAG: AAA family ATPase [Candidatus Babeliales bacterium]